MTKQEFLNKLRVGLSGLPQDETAERLTFYSEMIDDRMEEGLSEEDAVGAIGSVDSVIAQIVEEIPLTKIVKEKIKPKKKLNAWEIVLLALGSPIWLSIGVAVAAVIFSICVSLWSVLVSLWAVFGALIGCGIGGIVGGVVIAFGGNGFSGVALICAGMVCAGLSIFTFYGCKAATKGILKLTKKIAVWTKNRFIKKGEA